MTSPRNNGHERENKSSMPDVETLADELIDGCCDPQSIGQIYRFLLRVFCNDVSRARAEFKRFLSGDLSEDFLRAAARCADEDCSTRRWVDTCKSWPATL